MPLNFNVNYFNNFPQNAQAAVGRALATLSNLFNSGVNVDIAAYWGLAIGNNLTAITVPNGIENFLNAPLTNVWYTSALADKLAGQDLQANLPDMVLYFDSQNINWNTAQQQPQQNQYDLESVALHEVCHGLGMVGLYWVTGWPNIGSYGNDALVTLVTQLVQSTGQQLPFQLPHLNYHPSAYGIHIEDQAGHHLAAPAYYVNPSNQLGSTLVNGNLFFDHNHYQVYAPNPFVPFTSIEHLDPVAFPNSLMRPSIGAGQTSRQVDAPVQGILQAIGW